MDLEAFWLHNQNLDLNQYDGEICFYLSSALGQRGLEHRLRHAVMISYEKHHNEATGCSGCRRSCATFRYGTEDIPLETFWDMLFR